MLLAVAELLVLPVGVHVCRSGKYLYNGVDCLTLTILVEITSRQFPGT